MRILIHCGVRVFACRLQIPTIRPRQHRTTSTAALVMVLPFGGDSSDAPASDMPQLGVNSYLWRATLDTLNFMRSLRPIRWACP